MSVVGRSMSVCVVGPDSGYRDLVLDALRELGAHFCDAGKADCLLIVGMPDELPDYADRIVVMLLPDEEVERDLLHREDVLWLVPSLRDSRRLLAAADEAGEVVDVAVVHWSTIESPLRERTLPGEFFHVARGPQSSVKIPRRTGRLIVNDDGHLDGYLGVDLVIEPPGLLTLLDVLGHGIPVVVGVETALAEYVTHGVNGLVCSRADMETEVAKLLASRERLRAMTVAQPGIVTARRFNFLQRLSEHVLGGTGVKVAFAHGRKPGEKPWKPQPINGRGIRYQALVSFGATVFHTPDVAELSRRDHSFVLLGGRIPPERMEAISKATKKPVILAMNDAILEFPARLDWFREVGKYASMIFTGEPPHLLPKVPCKVIQLHQAPLNLIGPQRGTVRAPFEPMAPDPKMGFTFLANHWYPRRLELVTKIAQKCPLHIIGSHPTSIPHTRFSQFVRGHDYAKAMQRSVAVLSSSICNDREITSVRLFEACSVGAYVIAEEFPGCRDIYPDDCVSWFKTPEEAAYLGRMALNDPTAPGITEKRWRAQERTWRHYSAHDRMEFMLSTIAKEFRPW